MARQSTVVRDFRLDYAFHVHAPASQQVKRFKETLERNHVDLDSFDTLVGTGMSGALIVPTLARALRKHWLVVRKPDDGTHDYHGAVGQIGERWIFVDDFLSTGKTFQRVMRWINDNAQGRVYDYKSDSYKTTKTTFVGTYMYERLVWENARDTIHEYGGRRVDEFLRTLEPAAPEAPKPEAINADPERERVRIGGSGRDAYQQVLDEYMKGGVLDLYRSQPRLNLPEWEIDYTPIEE